mgnify:FL=1|tara:strand:+ start:161 stop:745 length:585 start_codon:yes stop_codon:yes gene_type:complete
MISEIVINAFLVTTMLGIAITIIRVRAVIFTVILTGAYSLVSALMFVTLDAVDVAFTEASVGAGISTILFVAAMAYLPKEETLEIFNNKHFFAILTCSLIGIVLIWCSYDLPVIGQANNPIHLHLLPEFLEGSKKDIGIPNVVTNILASYRGYDTFGEVIVIFTAGVSVIVLLQNSKINKVSTSKNTIKISKRK